jgi:methyltransferase (TIGR00027 family)
MKRFGYCLILLSVLAQRGFSFSTTKRQSSVRAFSGPKGMKPKMSRPVEQSGSPKMGPPSSVAAANGGSPGGPGGPPQSKGGPPGGGPPQSKGGPPAPTRAQQILEAALDVGFKLLYLGDDSGIQDSSKNLRVLWTRALLNNLGKIDDPIASDLLPRKTRWVVGQQMAKMAWRDTPAVEKLDWIVNRTIFIDSQLNEFLEETRDSQTNRQVVLLGSGYDTRSLRYSQSNIDVYEIDIPEVILMKSKMVNQYLENSPTKGSITFVPLDLNEVLTKNKNVVEVLKTQGFREDLPTIVVCEAVLFYLIPGAVQKMISDLFSLNANRYCIADNLAKVGVAPGPPVPSPREKCETWLKENGKELVAHDSLWGGAIHFVGAK